MHHVIQPGDTVLDIGAEEGDLSALYASWGADVVLFEPNPRVWANIKAIWDANQLRDPRGWFVGFAADETNRAMVEQGLKAFDRRWPICADGELITDHGFMNLAERPEVPAVRLDFYAEHTSVVPDVITIDVEGAELRVLQGAVETLAQHKPAVFVSIHPGFMQAMYGDHEDDVHKLFTAYGYESQYLCTDHEQHWFFQHPKRRRL